MVKASVLYFSVEVEGFDNLDPFSPRILKRTLDDVVRHHLGNEPHMTSDMYPCMVIMFSSAFCAYTVENLLNMLLLLCDVTSVHFL